MDNWTDKAIQRHIDDVIEESYLRSLAHDEIRDNLSHFVASCESLIRTNISLYGDIRVTKIKIALLRAHLIIDEHGSQHASTSAANGETALSTKLLARHVAQLKVSILRMLRGIDDELAETVLQDTERRTHDAATRRRKCRRRGKVIAAAGYYTLLAVSIAIFCIVLFL